MEDVTKKLDGVELMVTQLMDKLSGLETWKSMTDAATERLLSQAESVVSRLQRLEAVPPPQPVPPPHPATAPPQPSPRWTNQLDLNLAPRQEALILRRPGNAPLSTVRPRLTGMEVVGFLDTSRHTRSRV